MMKQQDLEVPLSEEAVPYIRRSPRKPRPTIRRESSSLSKTSFKKLSNLKFEPTTRRRSRTRLESEGEDGGSLSPSKETGSPSKRQRQGYASPEKYAHLDPLTDRLRVGLDGFTSSLLPPSAGPSLPEKLNIGLTDLVDRPTSKEEELSREEKIAAVPTFLDRISRFRPRIVCFVGLDIARIVKKRAVPGYGPTTNRRISPTKRASLAGISNAQGKRMKSLPPDGGLIFELVYSDNGPDSSLGDTLSQIPAGTSFSHQNSQSQDVGETLFFALPSTSGLAASYQLDELVSFFGQVKELRDEIKQGTLRTDDIPAVRLPLHDV
ncbi:hypothetical protein L218DRAFT_1079229 [Marasmius fiardii PR-910]|nr:hypothetical protein L218DRAFT_1079229 [Marasmius fiardii PR-910]